MAHGRAQRWELVREPVRRKGGVACGALGFLLSPLLGLPALPPPATSASCPWEMVRVLASGEEN